MKEDNVQLVRINKKDKQELSLLSIDNLIQNRITALIRSITRLSNSGLNFYINNVDKSILFAYNNDTIWKVDQFGQMTFSSMLMNGVLIDEILTSSRSMYTNTQLLTAAYCHATFLTDADLSAYITITYLQTYYYNKSESDLRFAPIVHNHDDRYYTETESDLRFSNINHHHNDLYALLNETYSITQADNKFAVIGHNHDDRYALASETYTETECDLRFAPIVHNHDDRYYTETEIDTTVTQLLTMMAAKNQGPIVIPTFSNILNGSFTVDNNGSVCFSTTSDGSGNYVIISNIVGTTLTPTDGITSYLACNYNNGSPYYLLLTNPLIMFANALYVPIARIIRVGNDIYGLRYGNYGLLGANKHIFKDASLSAIDRQTGFVLSEVATRIPKVSAGAIWFTVNLQSFGESLPPTTCILRRYYRSNNVWTSEERVSGDYDNLYYCLNGSVATMNNNYFASRYFFKALSDQCVIVYICGNQYNNSADAINELLPSPPDFITTGFLYVGKIVIQKNSSTGLVYPRIWANDLLTGTVNVHNNLSGLNDGEYKHLTTTQLTKVTELVTNNLSLTSLNVTGTISATTGSFSNGSTTGSFTVGTTINAAILNCFDFVNIGTATHYGNSYYIKRYELNCNTTNGVPFYVHLGRITTGGAFISKACYTIKLLRTSGTYSTDGLIKVDWFCIYNGNIERANLEYSFENTLNIGGYGESFKPKFKVVNIADGYKDCWLQLSGYGACHMLIEGEYYGNSAYAVNYYEVYKNTTTDTFLATKGWTFDTTHALNTYHEKQPTTNPIFNNTAYSYPALTCREELKTNTIIPNSTSNVIVKNAANDQNNLTISDVGDVTIRGSLTCSTLDNYIKQTDLKSSILNMFYPIGTIYQATSDSINPNTQFGGTWTKIEGKFLLSSSSTYSLGSTGGNANITLTAQQMPTHAHTYHETIVNLLYKNLQGFSDSNVLAISSVSDDYNAVTGNRGDGSSINIMPPYEVVHVWKRTA